jgi:uncharacterized protein
MLPDYVDIPIFPLPNVTFFPQTFLPLHVFEPRYRKLTKNALGGDRLIAVALLREGWQRDYFGRPPICKTFGVGKIVDHEQKADGCYNLMVEGLMRVRLVEEYPTRPYRTGRAHVLQDPPIDGRHREVAEMMKDMRQLCGYLSERLPQLREMIAQSLAASPHPLIIVNHLANSLVIDAYDRQSILEQDDPMRRLQLLLVQLRNIAYQLAGKRVREEVIEED